MDEFNCGAHAHKANMRATMLSMALLCACSFAQAQAPAPNDGAPSEAARRAAASPYRFILQNASAPVRKPAAPVEARKPAPPVAEPVQAAARPAPAPVAASVPLSTLAPSNAAAMPAAAAPAIAAPASATLPEPVTTAAHTRPAEPPVHVRREVIPVRTDEPRLAPALLREKPNGVVRVQFDIGYDGSTSAVKVVTSTNRALNRATLDAVNAWKFQPVDEILTVETEIAYKYD